MVRTAIAVVVLGLLVVTSGCLLLAGAAAGGAGYAYVKGEASQTYAKDIKTVYNACVAVIEDDMEFVVVDKMVTVVDGKIDARKSDDTKVEVKLEKLGEAATKVNIRVGVFGDETLSKLIFENIDARLQ